MRQLGKIPDERGQQNMKQILQQTIIINAAVDSLLLVSNMREAENKYASVDTIDIQKVFSSITKYMPLFCTNRRDENVFIDQFIDCKFPQVVKIQMNEVLFTALIKNIVLATLEYLQKIVQNNRSVMKIILFQIDVNQITSTDAYMTCSISFNINPRGAPKCIRHDSIYIETINTICKAIYGKCDVSDVSVTVTAPIKFSRQSTILLNNFPTKKLFELKANANKRSALVLYDNTDLVEALTSALETLMILQTVNFNQAELIGIIQLLASVDVVFVTAAIGEKLSGFKEKQLFVLYIGSSTESESLLRSYDYTITLPCMQTDVMELLNFISKYFFTVQQGYYSAAHFSEEIKDIENDLAGSDIVRVKQSVQIQFPSYLLKNLREFWHQMRGTRNQLATSGRDSKRNLPFAVDNFNYQPKTKLFMNVFNDDVEAEYTEWRLIRNKTYLNYAVLFIIVAPVLSNIKLMLDKNDPEPTVQSEQKSFLQKPIYLAALAIICIAIARRKFVHNNGYCSIYQWWRWVSIYLTIGNVIVTLSMMIQCKSGYCHYQYPSSKTLQTSDNIFLETFGMWPGNTIINLTKNNINSLSL